MTENRALKRAIREPMQETGEKYTEARRAVLEGTGAGQRSSMFNRFTERAKQVVVLAQEEARNLKHEHVGGEHILLGLLRGEVKRRTKVIGRFPGETSCLTLVWAVLDLYISHATNGIKFTQLERQRLKQMRYEGTEETTPEEVSAA